MRIIEIITLAVSTLIPYINNPRINDKAVERVAASIKEFGFKVPIIVDRDFVIIAGHTRLEAAKKLGMDEVPVIIADDLTPAQVKAFRIADNKLAELADWDLEKLEIELEGLLELDVDLELLGFNEKEMESLFDSVDPEVQEDDFDEEPPEVAVTQRGDIWQLGHHRLLCGDSTNTEDMKVLMNNQLANMCVTDPPYNVNYTGKTEDALTIQNDNMKSEDFYSFLLAAFERMYENLRDGAAIYVFHADTEGLNFRKAFVEAEFKLAQCCVWVKQSLVMGRQDYQWQHEPVLYGWKPTASHSWHSDRSQTTVWNFNKPNRSALHPTMKPIELIAYPIKNSSKQGDIVLDSFGGSGSTLMACEQLDRFCYCVELDERYCDVIVKRYADYAGCENIKLIRDGVEQSYAEAFGE